MNEKFKSNCLLYCEPLVHVSQSKSLQCALCGNEFQSEASCTQGHFICNACHSTSVFESIEKVYTQYNSSKPIELAVELMKALYGSTHRPENHFLVPAVLLSIDYNQKGDANEKEKKLKVARQRAENVRGGGYGFYGACGAGVVTGIFVSLITDITPLTTEKWGLSDQMTSGSLRYLGVLGGARCCKRDTFMALKTAKKFLEHKIEITLDVPDTVMSEYKEINHECIEYAFPFHEKERI